MDTNTTVITKGQSAVENYIRGESTGSEVLDAQLDGIRKALEMGRQSTVAVAHYISEIYRTGTFKEIGFKSEVELIQSIFDFTRDTISKYKRVGARYVQMVNGTPTIVVNGEIADYSVGALIETLVIPEEVVKEMHSNGFLNTAMTSKAVKQLVSKVKGIEFKADDTEEHKRALLVTAISAPNAIETKSTTEQPTTEQPTTEQPTTEPTATEPTATEPTAEHPTAPTPPKGAPENDTKDKAIHNLKWVLDDVRKTYAPLVGDTDFIKVLEAMARAMRKAKEKEN